MDELPPDVHAVERRMDALLSVRQVFHALWALSRAQLALAEQAAHNADAWLHDVAATLDRLTRPVAAQPDAPVLSVLVGPQRPWCGTLASKVLAEVPGGALGVVGARLAESALRVPSVQKRVAFVVEGPTVPDEVDGVARNVAQQLLVHGLGMRVRVMHPHGAEGHLVTTDLLPHRLEPVAYPPPTLSAVAQVADAVLRQVLEARITVAVAQAMYTEIRARVMATDRARTACDERLEGLERQRRVLRQEQITRELLEVVSARMAVGMP